MITKLKLCLVAVYAALSIPSAQAQTPPALESLFRFDGDWQGPTVLIYGGTTFNFTYYMSFKKNAENSGMTMEEWFSHPDLGSLKGYNLIGFNTRDEKIHWFSVDNFGTCHDHMGYWKTPDHFYMESVEKKDGKRFEERIDIIFISPTQVRLHLVALLGGKIFQDITGVFTKTEGVSGNHSSRSRIENMGDNALTNKPTNLNETKDIISCKVFPNPASQQVSFQVPESVLQDGLRLSLFNAAGMNMREIDLLSSTTTVLLNGFKPGVYFYKVTNQEKILYAGELIIS